MAKELERAGIATALLCNLVSIALRVGAPRIVPTRGIPYPTGDPSLAPAEERAWRRRLVEQALHAVSTAVKEPTVFELEASTHG
ncbi:MAG: glycine/betaine/sarcosine/D-proline family reductase selenoprotein B [Actinobacteria bacterium]|nr:glycine/betaine/sarcosine/D-proline family reductase selenoprotein B [Actinomycetota bacterium]